MLCFYRIFCLLIIFVCSFYMNRIAHAACGDGALPTHPVENPHLMMSGATAWLLCDLNLIPGDRIIIHFKQQFPGASLFRVVSVYKDLVTHPHVFHQGSNTTKEVIYQITTAGRYDVLTGTTTGVPDGGAVSAYVVKGPSKIGLSSQSGEILLQTGMQLMGNMLADRVRILSERSTKPIKLARGGAGAGKSAGEEVSGLSLWGDISASRLAGKDENDGFDGLVMSAVAGGDWQLSNEITLGAAIGLDHGHTETGQGGQSIESTQTGISLSPYGIWQMDNIFSLSAIGQIGYSSLRAASEAEEVLQDAWRASAELRGAAHLQYQQAYLLSELSLSYGMNHIAGAQTSLGNRIEDKTNHHADLSLRLQPGYRFDLGQGTQLESYVTGTYRYGFVMNKQPLDLNNALRLEDRDDLRAGLGLRYITDGIAAGIEASHLFLQEDYQDSRLKGSVEIKF